MFTHLARVRLGVDLFYWGVVDSVGQTFQLTDEQSAELRRHVSNGGSLLIEADSGEDLQAAQAALRAVVGADWIEGGGFGVGHRPIDGSHRQPGIPPPLDLDQDGFLTNSDRIVWVSQRMNTYFGDADLNGEFNSSDLVTILGSGSYESDTDSFWSSGDFDGDGRTDSSDLVTALADGGYEMGPRASTASVPEPSSIFLIALAILPFGRRTKQ